MSDFSDFFGEPIHSYSRAQAMADGFLVDVSQSAREAGFRYPVAVTRAVWESCVAIPQGVQGQDESGRLWDVLSMLRFAIQRAHGDWTTVPYALYVRSHNGERLTRRDLVELKAVCGPGDTVEPVITIMLPDED